MSSLTTSAPTGRRLELLDAAVRVVAAEGLRGLTHRAVDRRAGLAEGTCSAYLRTRQALQVAVAEHVAAALGGDVDRLAAELVECRSGDVEADDQRALALIAELFEAWLAQPDLVLAKLELTVEGSRNPAVAEVHSRWRERLTGIVQGVVAQDAARPGHVRAEALVAALDGLLLAALQRPVSERPAFLSGSLALVVPALAHPADPSGGPAAPG